MADKQETTPKDAKKSKKPAAKNSIRRALLEYTANLLDMKVPSLRKLAKPNNATLRSALKPPEHPQIKRVDVNKLNEETRLIYEESRVAATAAEDRELLELAEMSRRIRLISLFQLGFVTTLGVLAALLFGNLIAQASAVLTYIGGALFIALGLDPAVRFMEKRGVRRGLAIAIVYLGLFGVFAAVLAFIIPIVVHQITQLIESAPGMFYDMSRQPWYQDLVESTRHFVDLDRMLDDGRKFVSDPHNITTVAGGVLQAGVGILNGFAAFIVVLILSLYFLASMRSLKYGFYMLVPKSKRARVIDITEQVTESVGGYVSGQVFIALLNSTLGFIMMSIIGVPFAAVVAVVVFLFALIPLIGALAATVLVVLVALFASPGTALIAGIYYLIYMQIEAYIITPRVMNRVVSVPGAFVVIGALTGGTLLGIMGALVAIPVTASILMIVKQVWVPRQDNR
ncbi:MAG: AI-2E family transporter [Microbacteriaceae bacterium]|nr:AI-2E family transporter [Microbacteriaceae bacterium]